MPVIMGNDKNEGYIFIFTAFKRSVGMLKYDLMLALLGGDKGLSMLQKYPAVSFATDWCCEGVMKGSIDYFLASGFSDIPLPVAHLSLSGGIQHRIGYSY